MPCLVAEPAGGTRAPFRLSAVECDVQPEIEVGRIAYALLLSASSERIEMVLYGLDDELLKLTVK